ncbi:TPA: AAA family ATPase, partial [Legionella anisa]
EQIVTGHQRTIIASKEGKLYGFGDNTEGQLGESSSYANWSQVTPIRLLNFEKLQPRAIAIGKHAVVVLSAERECHFYGIDMNHSMPINYMKKRTITLPPEVKPEQISFTYEHLVVLSEQGELWEVGKGLRKQQRDKKDHTRFVKVNLPKDGTIKSALAGYHATFIFNTEDRCYALGRNDDYKLGLTQKNELYESPQRLSLRDSYWWEKTKISKTAPTKYRSPAFLFSEYEQSSQYQDNTEVIQILEEEDDRVIEILRPLTFNTALTLSMLYAFYANTGEVDPAHFHHKKIGKNQELVKNHLGAYPVVVVDLGRLDLSSYSSFQDSFKQLLADLYIQHRPALFQGPLKEKHYKKDQYQDIAMQSGMFLPRDALSQLIKYLNKHYGKKVKLFINHADICIRTGLLKKDYEFIASELKKYINPALSNPLVSQTVLMGVHPSFFEAEEFPVKHIHGMTSFNSKYIPFFQGDLQQTQLEKNHFIHGLRIKSDECEQIRRLLEENTIEIVAAPEKTIKDNEVNLFHCFIQLGLLVPTVKEANTEVLSCHIANPQAKSILQTLHKKWHIQNMNRVTLIFDIDNVLAMPETCTLQTILFFLRKGAVIKAYGVTHYIPPGILELMRVLFSMPLVKVAFFSSGDKRRNEAFVKELLIKALGEQRYAEIAAEIIILSGHHMSDNIAWKDEQQQKKYGLPHSSNGKKDISYAIAPEDTLGNAIFIDNNPGFICYDQEEHYLHMETVKSNHFDSLNQSEKPCNNPEDDLFRKVNAAFYLAGVLSECIQSKDKEPLSQKLFSLQFTSAQVHDQEFPTFTPCWDQPKKSLAIYEKGLQLLQQFNSDLTLITPAHYKECVAKPASENQQTVILDAKKNEHVDCLVM